VHANKKNEIRSAQSRDKPAQFKDSNLKSNVQYVCRE
jgi:hypothetical protein